MRMAVLADIHGNLPALEAVIADMKALKPDLIVVAGDMVNRCPWSNEVLDLVHDEGWPSISGNHEVVISTLGTPASPAVVEDRERFADLWWTWRRLRPENLTRLGMLPPDLRIDSPAGPAIRLQHGLVENPFKGYLDQMSDAEMAADLQTVTEPVVISAHTHQPMARDVGGWVVYNPGSVGMPYNGDPRAQYMLLDAVDDTWRPTFRRLEYPIDAVRRKLQEIGLVEAYGPLGPLYLETIETGQPWVSDFLFWQRSALERQRQDLSVAVAQYQAQHGPGQWAFVQAESAGQGSGDGPAGDSDGGAGEDVENV